MTEHHQPEPRHDERGGAHQPPPPPPPAAPSHGQPRHGQQSYGTPPAGSYGQAPPPPGGYGQPYGQQLLSPSDQRMWGMLAHLGSLVTALVGLSFLGPLIVYLVHKDRGAFVRKHAAEALNFQILVNVVVVVCVVLTFITLGIAGFLLIPLLFILGIVALVLVIVAAVKANNGEEYRYPVNWRLVS